MLTREDLPVRELEKAYDLGPWTSAELLPGGKSQHHRFVAGGEEYVVRRSYPSKTPESIRSEHELARHLRDRGFPALTLVPAADGDACAVVDGRLYSVSVYARGSAYEPGNHGQLREAARALARYHGIVASFRHPSPAGHAVALDEDLRLRLARAPSPNRVARFLDEHDDPEVSDLLAALPETMASARETSALLDRLYPSLPKLTIHGGCRRGSLLFRGERLVTVLDFDSARPEARVVDLAVALHDFAKIFGEDRSSPSSKVALDLDVVRTFLAAYSEVRGLEPEEAQALPALMRARPLKRALGKFRSMVEGGDLSAGHLTKTAREVARARWLREHDGELRAAL